MCLIMTLVAFVATGIVSIIIAIARSIVVGVTIVVGVALSLVH